MGLDARGRSIEWRARDSKDSGRCCSNNNARPNLQLHAIVLKCAALVYCLDDHINQFTIRGPRSGRGTGGTGTGAGTCVGCVALGGRIERVHGPVDGRRSAQVSVRNQLLNAV
jgi:hypothetical protein